MAAELNRYEEQKQRLRMLWGELVGSYGDPHEDLPPYTEFWIERIIEEYTHVDRYYHTLDHIIYALNTAWRIAGGRDIRTVEFAIFFHDFVYNPQRKDNEEASADVAWKALVEMGFGDKVIQPVRRYIEVTKSHNPLCWEEAVMCDADMAILAAPQETYWNYAEGVELEYYHLTEDQWFKGRGDWIESMLKRSEIFHTEVMHGKTEQAKLNLRRELDYLAVRTTTTGV